MQKHYEHEEAKKRKKRRGSSRAFLQNKVLIGHGLSPMIINTCRFVIGNDFCKTLYIVRAV
jgi:hypothetical protein